MNGFYAHSKSKVYESREEEINERRRHDREWRKLMDINKDK